MAFALGSYIELGKYKAVKPIDVKVEKSIFQYTDKALIRLPITARIKTPDTTVSETLETAKAFNEGDAVLIQLGYNGSLKTEFEGFVSRVNFTQPVEVECEGYSYQLRKKSYQKTFVKAQLLDVLTFLIAGTDIVLDEEQIPSFVIEKLVLQKHSGTEALELIKKISHNLIYVIFSGRSLYAGLLGLDYKNLKNFPQKPNVKYRLGWNVIKSNDLKLRQAKNQDYTVHYIGEKKDGTKEKITVGGKAKTIGAAGVSGETITKRTHAVTDTESLTKLAEADLLKNSYDGYEGKLTTFLQPYCEPAYRAAVEDLRYPERSGNYLVESVETTYGASGARRKVGLGLKL